MPDVVVEGVALWASRLPGWELARAVMRGEQPAPGVAHPRPVSSLLAATERRRAPDSVVLALEVAASACAAAGRAAESLPSVFASTHGDLGISDYMCATLASAPALLSPTKFHNSVHNAAAGYWSIGTRSAAPYTAISAFHHTFAVGLLETITQVVCESGPVLYVAFDVEAKGPLATVIASRGLLGAALVIGPAAAIPRSTSQNDSADQGAEGMGAAGGSARRRLSLRVESGIPVQATPARSAAAACVQDNALAPCLPLFEALANPQPSSLCLALGERTALHVQVS